MLSFRAAGLLMQDAIWEGRDGRVRLDAMDARRQRALLGWLRAHADGLHHARETDLLLTPGVDAEREHHALRVVAPAVWLEDTPLVRRLATLAMRRRPLTLGLARRLHIGTRRWWR